MVFVVFTVLTGLRPIWPVVWADQRTLDDPSEKETISVTLTTTLGL